MLQSCFEQLSWSSGAWHSFPQPVARRPSETQLYSELLQAPRREEEGRGEEGRGEGGGREEGSEGGSEGRNGRGEKDGGKKRDRVSSNLTNICCLEHIL